MTKSKPPDLNHLLGHVRNLTNTYLTDQANAFGAFVELVNCLFKLTVLSPKGAIKLIRYRPSKDKAVLAGWNPNEPLPLNDGNFLRFYMSMYISEGKLKTETASYQYQRDKAGKQWVFRYDYLREGQYPHPPAHLQIKSDFEPLPKTPLERIHFPIGRISIEALIRLLADQFGIPCNQPDSVWRRVLTESEQEFLKIAHLPLSGPLD